jgi:hypothetical protein
MLNFKLHTPVAFIIFNRPDTTALVFAEIAKAKPSKLLVISDGPRAGRVGEVEKLKAARAIIAQVDWPCEVLTHYSDENLGCKRRLSSGLDWVFSVVEEAIILEDDCVPDQSFFRYCQELLEFYRNDLRVGMINGSNHMFGKLDTNDSYYFSLYGHVWGWASWRNRWQDYDVDMKKWPALRDGPWLKEKLGAGGDVKKWRNDFDAVYNGKIDTWDYQLVFAHWVATRLSIAPTVNLVSNIGFNRPDATHTKGRAKEAAMPTIPVQFPLQHASKVEINLEADVSEVRSMTGHSLGHSIRNILDLLLKLVRSR